MGHRLRSYSEYKTYIEHAIRPIAFIMYTVCMKLCTHIPRFGPNLAPSPLPLTNPASSLNTA